MHERIRRRREERDIPAYVLAKRLNISPSYVSLIESGKKVPSEDIARRIAEALDDDVEIYVAWAHSAGIDDIDSYAERLLRLRRYSSDPTLRRRLGSGEDIEDGAPVGAMTVGASRSIIPELLRSTMGRWTHGTKEAAKHRAAEGRARAAPPGLTEVPFLEEGADPAAPADERRVAGRPLQLDARLFAEEDLGRLFAYRATRDMASRAGGSVHPGDWVILTSRVEPHEPQSIFAVRTQGRIVLSRVLFKGPSLLLLPPPGKSDFEIVELQRDEELSRVLAGRVLMSIRGVD